MAVGAGERTYYATLGPYPRGRGRIPRPQIAVAASQRPRPDPVSCESRDGGDGGGRSDFKRRGRGRTFLSRGRGTAAHIRGRNSAAARAMLLWPPQMCFCVLNPAVVLLCLTRKVGGLDQRLKNEQSSARRHTLVHLKQIQETIHVCPLPQ